MFTENLEIVPIFTFIIVRVLCVFVCSYCFCSYLQPCLLLA